MSQLLTAGYWIDFWHRYGERIGLAALKIAALLVAYYIVRYFIVKFIDRMAGSAINAADGDLLKARRARILAAQSVFKSVAKFVLAFVVGVMILQAAGINIVPLLTTAGIAGLAIGFGAQKLVKDVINGIFILSEDQYGVGDYVTIGAASGIVEELGMRATRIRDNSGRLHIISNGDISAICNESRGRVKLPIDIGIASIADVDKVCDIIRTVGDSLAADFPDRMTSPFRCEGIIQFTGACVTLRAVAEVKPKYQEQLRLEFNNRAVKAMSESGVTTA